MAMTQLLDYIVKIEESEEVKMEWKKENFKDLHKKLSSKIKAPINIEVDNCDFSINGLDKRRFYADIFIGGMPYTVFRHHIDARELENCYPNSLATDIVSAYRERVLEEYFY